MNANESDNLNSTEAKAPKKKTKRKLFRIFALLALAPIALSFTQFFYNKYFEISHPISFSMMPTIIDGDTVLLSRGHDFEQFNVILCKLEIVNPGGRLVKRVVAVGGQWIEIKDNLLYITEIIDDEEVVKIYHEPYLDYGNITLSKTFVRKGQVYLLGDNRPFSHDSKDFGSIEEMRVVARVVMRDVGKPILLATQFPNRR